uniref:Uncharacterized protein n=1 Tax=Rhinolophus ferrumequinum TaxID=59479 RepID=A0A671F235_RHIFE
IVVGGQERPFYLILEAESVHCPSWIGPASGSSVYSEWTFLPATVSSFNKEPKLPKETLFASTRYNLGSSAIRETVLGNVLHRLSCLTRIPIALLHNFLAEAMKRMTWDRYSKILGQISPILHAHSSLLLHNTEVNFISTR